MKTLLKAFALAGLLTAVGAHAANADGPAAGGYKDVILVPETWWDAGDVFVRVRAEAFIPNVSTRDWNYPAGLASAIGRSPDLSASTTILPELDLSYFLTRNIALELVCCFGREWVQTAGSASALGKVGDTWFFPPQLLLQYHFTGYGPLKPYVGIGAGYVWFFDESASRTFQSLKLNGAPDIAFQAGFDYHLQGNWFLNVDFKYLALSTDWSVLSGHVTGHIDIDPIIAGAGLGYRFGSYVPLK